MPKITPQVEVEYVQSIFAHYCSGVLEPSFCGILFHRGDLPYPQSKKLQKHFGHTRLLGLVPWLPDYNSAGEMGVLYSKNCVIQCTLR